MSKIIILGGTFDPIHNGHLSTAISIQKEFRFDRFLFLPCKSPILKPESCAITEDRINMIELAIAPYPDFILDLREIKRNTPSFMVDTLESIRVEHGPTAAITLLLGMDAFLQLPQWHEWQKILSLAHLMVMHRPLISEKTMPANLQALLLSHETYDKNEILTKPFGNIYRYDAGNYNISSTKLRNKLKKGETIHGYLPDTVEHYIKENKLY